MGGRTATLLLAGSACAAVLVLTWSLLAAVSLTGATPYWLGSLGVIAALGAAFLIFKDLVLWPVRFLGPRMSRLGDLVKAWLTSLMAVRRPQRTEPLSRGASRARRRH